MKIYQHVFFLLLLMAGSAAAYEYHMPVNVQCTSTPAVLMPGDEALLAIEMQSGSASYGVGKDAGSGSTAQSSLLSTPLNKTVLKSAQDLKVLTADYSNLGMIGPDDKITAYYKIKASDNITSGTYLLGFQVQGGYDVITINRELPIKVDSATVNMARAEASTTKQSFNLNVANPRENTLNAVTIVPSAKGIKFSPDEYYIGTMDPDEVFTISFSPGVRRSIQAAQGRDERQLRGQVQERGYMAPVSALCQQLYSARGHNQAEQLPSARRHRGRDPDRCRSVSVSQE